MKRVALHFGGFSVDLACSMKRCARTDRGRGSGGGGGRGAGAGQGWRRGFTLVELIAVLVVLGVLAAAMVARLGTTSTTRRSAAGQLVLRDVGFARERAMNVGLVHWVTVVTGASSSYTIAAEPTVGAGYAARVALVEPASGRSMQRVFNRDELSGVTLTSATATEVGFSRLGRPLDSTGAARSADFAIVVSGGATVTITNSTGALTLTP